MVCLKSGHSGRALNWCPTTSTHHPIISHSKRATKITHASRSDTKILIPSAKHFACIKPPLTTRTHVFVSHSYLTQAIAPVRNPCTCSRSSNTPDAQEPWLDVVAEDVPSTFSSTNQQHVSAATVSHLTNSSKTAL